MTTLEGPVKRHLMGKLPTHSSTVSLHKNFVGLTSDSIKAILFNGEYISEEGKPTKKALQEELLDVCERNIIWNLDKVQKLFLTQGITLERKYVNQDLPEMRSEPTWANLGTISTYFSTTSNQVGKWLDELELRDEDGMASESSLKNGLATTVEMHVEGKKTRKITHWNLHLILEELMESGHPLDFDYEKSLIGTGKNSDVKVSSIDDRAREFAKEFARLYKDPERRKECPILVRKTASGVILKAEELLKMPGFISKKQYLRH